MSRPFDLSSGDSSTNAEVGGGCEDICDEAPKVQRADHASDDLPKELCCPLTLELFLDPVKTIHGHTYERAAIQGWFRTNTTDPMTREDVPVTTLHSDEDMRKRCDELRLALLKTPGRVLQLSRAKKGMAKESARARSVAANAQQHTAASLAAQVTKHAKRKTVRAGDIDLVAAILARNGMASRC